MFINDKVNKKLVRFLNLISEASNNENGKNIKISSDINIIGKNSFKDDDFVESVTTCSSINVVEESAFENCSKLVYVKFGEDLDKGKIKNLTIQSNAFKNCQELREVAIYAEGESEIVIEKDAFANCCKLRTLYINPANLFKIEIRSGVFDSVDKERFTIFASGSNYEKIEQFARENGYKFISAN